jgi:hypothetical protein
MIQEYLELLLLLRCLLAHCVGLREELREDACHVMPKHLSIIVPSKMKRDDNASLRRQRVNEEAAQMKQDAIKLQGEATCMHDKATKMKHDMEDDAERAHQRENKGKNIEVNEEKVDKVDKVDKKEEREEEENEREQSEQDAATYIGVAKRQYQNRIKGFSQKDHKCPKCWLIRECCVCDKIAPVSTKHECILTFISILHFTLLLALSSSLLSSPLVLSILPFLSIKLLTIS